MNIKRYGINNSDDIRNTFNSLLVSKSWSLNVMFRGGEKNKQMKHQTRRSFVTRLRFCVIWPAWLWRVAAGRRRRPSACRTAGTRSVLSVPGWRSDRCVCPSLRWLRRPARRIPRPPCPPHAPTWFPCRPLEPPGSGLCVYAEWSVTEGDRSVSETLNAETHPIPAFFTNYYRTWNIKIIKAILTQAKTSQLSLFPVYKRKFPHFHQIQSKFVPGSDTFSPIHHFVPSLNLKAIIFLPPTEDYNPISNLRVGKPQENAPLTAFLLISVSSNPSTAGDSKSKWPLTV